MATCLNEKHWNLFDVDCIDCKAEVRESSLLTDQEFLEWLSGKLSLGFKIKARQLV